MTVVKKTAKEIVQHWPGAGNRRQALLVALCQGLNVGTYPSESHAWNPQMVGQRIVDVANHIIEETEQ